MTTDPLAVLRDAHAEALGRVAHWQKVADSIATTIATRSADYLVPVDPADATNCEACQ